MKNKLKLQRGQIILFDLDYTLHDPAHFRQAYQQKIVDLFKIDEAAFEKARSSYQATLPKSTHFHPHHFTSHVAQELDLNAADLRKQYYQNSNYEQAIFKETINVLPVLKQKFILGVFSEGQKNHQYRKIKQGKLLHFFDPRYIFIFLNKRTNRVLEKLPKKVVIVDDNPEVIDLLLNKPGITPIWINRKDKTRHSLAYTIHSLEELVELK